MRPLLQVVSYKYSPLPEVSQTSHGLSSHSRHSVLHDCLLIVQGWCFWLDTAFPWLSVLCKGLAQNWKRWSMTHPFYHIFWGLVGIGGESEVNSLTSEALDLHLHVACIDSCRWCWVADTCYDQLRSVKSNLHLFFFFFLMFYFSNFEPCRGISLMNFRWRE